MKRHKCHLVTTQEQKLPEHKHTNNNNKVNQDVSQDEQLHDSESNSQDQDPSFSKLLREIATDDQRNQGKEEEQNTPDEIEF